MHDRATSELHRDLGARLPSISGSLAIHEAELRRGAFPSGSLRTRKQKMAGSNLTNLANLAKFKSCEKVYDIRKLANLVNFFSMIRWDFEDLFHLATMTLKSDAELRRGRSQAGAWERD